MSSRGRIRKRDSRFDAFSDTGLQQLTHQIKKECLPWLILNIAVVWGGIFLFAESFAAFLDAVLISAPAGMAVFLAAVALSTVISIMTYRRIILFFEIRKSGIT